MKRLLVLLFALAASCAAWADVPPVLTPEPVVEKWGEEAEKEVQGDGVLFFRADKGVLYIGDGETPGGKAVCVGLPEDLYSWTNDVAANGHALRWNDRWSQVAEGGSLLLRFGTNSWLRLVGTTSGELANLTVSDFQFDTSAGTGTMRITADTTDPGAILEVATNLMEAVAWQTATNGEIVATTDASTTWLITLLDTPFETYRVRTTTSLEAGIHAEKKIVAHEGIEMGTNTWTDWPASAEAVAGAVAHVSDTNNPHGVTAEQIGALTAETDATALDALYTASNALNGAISGHIADTDNPHGVTATQTGALPLDGGGVVNGNVYVNQTNSATGRLSHGWNVTNGGPYSFVGGEGSKTSGQDSFATGYYTESSGFGSFASGGRTKASGSYAEAAGRYASSTNDRAYTWQGANTSTVYGSHGDGTWNINPQGGLSGAYVGETNLADHLAAAIAPVEERVGELEALHERPETCYLYWPPEYVSTNGGADGTNYVNIPTNFPTRRLNLTVCDAGLSNCFVNVPLWVPDSPKEIVLRFERTSVAPTNRNAKIFINGLSFNSSTIYSNYRFCRINYDPDCGAWRSDVFQLSARGYFYPDGIRTVYPTNFPATVEEWVAVQDGSPSQTLSISPSLSPSLSPLSPAVLQPEVLEALDVLEQLDEPEEEWPEEAGETDAMEEEEMR